MRFIEIPGYYINIDHIVTISVEDAIDGHYYTVIRLSNGKDIYTNEAANHVVHLIEMAEKKGKEVSR